MNTIIKAEAGGLIWVVVGVFWVIAQIAGAAAKKNQPPRPVESDDRPGETPGDPFAELLRKMAGAQTFELPQPEYEEEQEEALAATERMPDIEPLRRETMGQTDMPPDPVELTKIAIHPAQRTFRNTLPAMKLPAMTLRFQPLEKTGRNVPNLGNVINPADKSTLRRAMLSHIIFSPPKALSRTSE